MTAPEPGTLAAAVEALGPTMERTIERALGCRKGPEAQELDADLRPASPPYALCESRAHDHAYYDRFCGFANNLASLVLVDVQDALAAHSERGDEQSPNNEETARPFLSNASGKEGTEAAVERVLAEHAYAGDACRGGDGWIPTRLPDTLPSSAEIATVCKCGEITANHAVHVAAALRAAGVLR